MATETRRTIQKEADWHKRSLQIAIAVAALVPIGAGIWGIVNGPDADGASIALGSHYRYLSGLLLAIGLAWLISVPRIEHHSDRILVLTLIVMTGGLARVYALAGDGSPGAGMILAIGMELLVTPLLCLWQRRVARLASAAARR